MEMGRHTEVADKFSHCLESSHLETQPYRFWLLKDVFTQDVSRAIKDLPFAPSSIGETEGRRETHNTSRTFFSEENRGKFDVCRDVAEVLQSKEIVRKLEKTCWINLKGSYLRIEYCQDSGDFWLEPHTDIPEKLFTMLVYLSTDPGSQDWGTDVYDDDMKLVATAPYKFNDGLIFIAGPNTFHGFHKRRIDGVRKLIIVNYVRDGWRARDQLAFPDQPIG